jgi:hypothetical protein
VVQATMPQELAACDETLPLEAGAGPYTREAPPKQPETAPAKVAESAPGFLKQTTLSASVGEMRELLGPPRRKILAAISVVAVIVVGGSLFYWGLRSSKTQPSARGSSDSVTESSSTSRAATSGLDHKPAIAHLLDAAPSRGSIATARPDAKIKPARVSSPKDHSRALEKKEELPSRPPRPRVAMTTPIGVCSVNVIVHDPNGESIPANVFIDGKLVEQSPLHGHKFPCEAHVVHVEGIKKWSGYRSEPRTKRIKPKPGVPANAPFKLFPNQ